MTALDSTSAMRAFREIAADIKLAHSVFALPFALLAAFMAAPFDEVKGVSVLTFSAEARGRFTLQLALIVLAMVCARTVAMLSNRYLDRHIDARNPRTANRALPAGRLSTAAALAAIAAGAGFFVITCALFGFLFNNWYPLILSVPVLLWICAYGWFKRFTALCHIYLGSSLALSPLAAAIAIDPATVLGSSPLPALFLISAMVLCWVAGFDVIYALQDVEIDRAQQLHSLPSRVGESTALLISRLLHIAAIVFLAAAVAVDSRLHLLFALAIAVAAVLLVYEHLTVHRWGKTKIALAFFTLNGIVACLLGLAGILDVLI